MDLSPFTGTWRGTWKTWLEPGVLHDESPIAATGESMAEGRHVKLEYRGRVGGDDVTGFVLIGPGTSDMAVAWIDTWHTGGAIYLGAGKVVDGGVTVPFEWEAEGETWIWTSDYRLEDGSLAIRHYNEGGGLERYLGVEAIFEPV